MRSRPLAAVAAALLAVTLAACSDAAATPAATGEPDATLPTTIPAGTKLVVGDPSIQVAVKLAGDDLHSDLGFEIEWANVSGGPATT